MEMNRFSNELKAIADELDFFVMVLRLLRDALDKQIAAARESLKSIETAVEVIAAHCEEE